jgi:class 3 adenylate cyclase
MMHLTPYIALPRIDLFPETTIMFADIAGFTAWSSAREPSQVFTLLEGIYSKFDRVAHRRKVFKVEVVGDCYVVSCSMFECFEMPRLVSGVSPSSA